MTNTAHLSNSATARHALAQRQADLLALLRQTAGVERQPKSILKNSKAAGKA